MIPKIIHYCWFGRGEMPRLMKKCLRSWKKYCPDWEILRWDEDSFDVNSILWTKQAYEAKKYAFVSDYVRLKALYEQGGVYLDTDIQLKKSLLPFLKHEVFLGFENKNSVASCVIGAKKNQLVIKSWLDTYNDQPFICNGKTNSEPNVIMITNNLIQRGLQVDNQFQIVDGVAVYPQTWFCPQNIEGENRALSKDTVSIHHFTSTWRSAKGIKDLKRAKFHSTKIYRTWEKVKILPQRCVRKLLGDDRIDRLKERLKK